MSLADYGYTDRFRVYENQYPEYIPARVISQERGLYTVLCATVESLAQRFQAGSDIRQIMQCHFPLQGIL